MAPKEKRADTPLFPLSLPCSRDTAGASIPFPSSYRGVACLLRSPPPAPHHCSPADLSGSAPSLALCPAAPRPAPLHAHPRSAGEPAPREQTGFSWSLLRGAAQGLAVPAGTGRTRAERAPCFSDKGLGGRPRLSQSWLCLGEPGLSPAQPLTAAPASVCPLVKWKQESLPDHLGLCEPPEGGCPTPVTRDESVHCKALVASACPPSSDPRVAQWPGRVGLPRTPHPRCESCHPGHRLLRNLEPTAMSQPPPLPLPGSL